MRRSPFLRIPAPLHLLLLALVARIQAQQSTSSSYTTTNQQNRGHDHRHLIIGGHIAEPGRYPYFSTLHHECGGALIAPDTILTAGHCLPHHLDSVEPHVGSYHMDRHGHASDGHESFAIVNMTRHEKWHRLGEDEFRHDLALLFLDRPSFNHSYVRINRNPLLPEAYAPLVAMGVGWTSNDYEHALKSDILRDVELNYLPNEECVLSHSVHTTDDDDNDDDSTYQHRIHHDHLCTTGGPHNERDACAYDSGSPIIIPGKTARDDVLVALVSWGEGCADPNFPAVNARITDALDFINDSVCNYSKYPPPDFECGGPMAPTPRRWQDLSLAMVVALVCLVVYQCRRQRNKTSSLDDNVNDGENVVSNQATMLLSPTFTKVLNRRFSTVSTVAETESLLDGASFATTATATGAYYSPSPSSSRVVSGTRPSSFDDESERGSNRRLASIPSYQAIEHMTV